MLNRITMDENLSVSPHGSNTMLAEALVVGAKIKIGKQYADKVGGLDKGEIITLVEGHFEYDNGLYTEDQTAPAIWNGDDFDSIYHLFGNNLEDFMDCEVVS